LIHYQKTLKHLHYVHTHAEEEEDLVLEYKCLNTTHQHASRKTPTTKKERREYNKGKERVYNIQNIYTHMQVL